MQNYGLVCAEFCAELTWFWYDKGLQWIVVTVFWGMQVVWEMGIFIVIFMPIVSKNWLKSAGLTPGGQRQIVGRYFRTM